MAITLPDARELSDDVLEALRLRALRGGELGFTEADLASILGVARETVSRWVSAYRSGGVGELPGERTGRPVGSGRILTDEQADRARALIEQNSPRDLGIAAPLWTRPAVRELIRREFGVELAVRTVGEYLKRWGHTAKRPRRKSKDQDPEEVREWVDDTYPRIERRAAEEGATIHFCDETGTAADRHPRLGYAPRGERATMEVPGPHIRVNVVSTVNDAGEAHFETYTGTMTGARFVGFLGRLAEEIPGKVYLIADRLGAHDCEEVWDWLSGREDRIEVFFLPRRSPELNPDEYLNNDLKGNVHAAGLPDNKAQLRGQVEDFLESLVNSPEHVESYFHHPCARYAIGS